MNLALHGFLLQVLLSILNLQHGSLLCSAGEPGYLDFDNLPETNFSCQGKVIGGYYADVEAGCQMFHVCTIGQKDEIMDIKFLCLNGTVFDQETRVCERVDEVDCSKSERFYNLNLELYGNNAVTLSLHENSEDDIESSNPGNDHQRTTSARPTSSTTTSTTTSNPNKPSSTPSPTPFSHSTGYPQHFQPQPVFPPVHTSQSKSLYDDKNGRYHHQYIFHTGERSNNQQATSYQLFSNQGVSSTTAQPPQVHQIRFSSTASPQIIHNEPSTVAPLFHATSSTIQTLLNSNGNSPALINPIFHSHGIASTTEQFSIHSNNPRETSDYRESGEQGIRPLEAIQSTNKGKVSKLTISPVPTPEPQRSVQTKISSQSSEQRISGNFLPTPAADETTVRSFYPTPRISAKPGQGSQSNTEQVTQHIHVLPPVPIPQLKPHQITINLPPPDLQRIVQNPSSLLPSQSRVIVTAKASVSDESGRPLNTTQLVTLPLPTIPASYDDYKEGDESFDPFYRDVPKIRNHRHVARERTVRRFKRSVGQTMNSMVSFMYGGDSTKRRDAQSENLNEKDNSKDKISLESGRQDFKTIKESLIRFRDILFGGEFTEDTIRNVFEGSRLQEATSGEKIKTRKKDSLEDLETKASKNFKAREYDEDSVDEEGNEKDDVDSIDVSPHGVETSLNVDTKESDAEEYIDIAEKQDIKLESEESEEGLDIKHSEEIETDKEVDDDEEDISTVEHESEESKLDLKPREPQGVIDVVILDPEEYSRLKSSGQDFTTEKEETTTEISTVSSTEETTQKTIDNYFEAKNKSSTFEGLTDNVEENSQQQKIESEQQTIVEEEKPKEQKPAPRRKSARIRSSRGKISARKKEMKIVNHEIVKIPEEKVAIENIETTTVKVNSEAEVIDKHIFDEPESQTSKEVDTRAVNNHSAYPKSLQTGKGQDLGKGNQKGEANEYETLQKQSKNLEDEIKHIDKIVKNEEKTTVRTPYDNEPEEEVKIEEEEYDDKLDEPEKLKENISIEEKSYYKEVSSIEHEEVDHESTTTFDKENSREEDDSDSEFTKNSRRDKSMKFEDSNYSKEISSSHKQDKTKNIKDDDEDDEVVLKEKEESREVQEYSTIKGEEINSHEMSEEYEDSTETFNENIHEDSAEEDYEEDAMNLEDSTTSSENVYSKESQASNEQTSEDDAESISVMTDHEETTEGVLKFTDELPKEKKDDVSEDKKSSEPVEDTAHDYVDDNYEPDNYKERESSDSNNFNDEKDIKDTLSDAKIEDSSEEKLETTTEPDKTVNEHTDSEEVLLETTTTPSSSTTTTTTVAPTTTTTAATTTTTTSTTTTTTTTTTTPAPTTTTTSTTTTTTARPTPPKLFKPISARKSYNYVPPTTTPNPVIIKPRLSLLNPKPAKPPKSYNELAPKPVIRKFSLLTRKPTTTIASTTITDEDSTEMTEIPTTIITTTTETGKSEENILESKLETANESREREQLAPVRGDDQDSSPSEQKSPTNVKKEDEETFTPYPVARLSTLGFNIEKTLKEGEVSSTDAENATTPRNFTLLDVEVIGTTADPVSSSLETSYPGEVFSTTAQSTITEEDRVQWTTKPPVDVPTEIPNVVPSTESTTVLDTTIRGAEATTTVRSLNKKMANQKKQDGFNCLEKEMYRFYGDNRDCRLFHYCSPGFTSRQVLDFRFVCEEGTAFDEASQSCLHDPRNSECLNRQW